MLSGMLNIAKKRTVYWLSFCKTYLHTIAE